MLILNIAKNIWVYSTLTHQVGGWVFLQFCASPLMLWLRWIVLILVDFAHFPPPTSVHFLDVVCFFNMIWLFLWLKNVFNVRQGRRTPTFLRLAHPTWKHFADAMGEDATVMKKTQRLKTRCTYHGCKICVFQSVYSLDRSFTLSDVSKSLWGNEQSWANRSGHSPRMSKWANRSFFLANHSFAHFWAKKERFAQK